jgi:hypothetical protein
MFVSKNVSTVPNNNLMVDSWKVKYVDNPSTASSEGIETYGGLELMNKTEKQKYLGFVLSNKGDNMDNIKEMKSKSVWIIRKIFTRLNGLNLKKYYFECAIVFLNVMLRSSILYACETYYNLKESEVRQLERLEERFLRQMFRTSKGCPISQLYLESGHIPARFEVKKIRLLFLQYILQENNDSLIHRFLKLQFKNPTRGDWASSCVQDLKYLEIEISIKDIQMLTKTQFNKILKESIQSKALKYLINKRGSKGQEIRYLELKMAEYLMPNFENLSIDDRRNIFEIRNRMLLIPANFPSSKDHDKCLCGEIEDTKHIYLCKYWSNESEKTQFEMIYTDNMSKLVQVYKQFNKNYKRREGYKIEKQNGQ